ncbi:MAG: CBS domain-containing protein [Halioglobus sp.]|nr:CBS domain-containing protein [Halioglobus sp.]
MFAIYDTYGRQFRDPLEQLRKVRKPPGSAAMAGAMDTGLALREDAKQAANQPFSQGAVQAYREARKIPEREAVVHAYQIMSHPVQTASVNLDVQSALRRLRELGYQQLPVLDEQQRLVGIVSERDLLRTLVMATGGRDTTAGRSIADAMSADVITADPVTDIRRIARVMLEYRLSAMPVVDERDALVGLVSRSDILRGVSSDPPLSLWT